MVTFKKLKSINAQGVGRRGEDETAMVSCSTLITNFDASDCADIEEDGYCIVDNKTIYELTAKDTGGGRRRGATPGSCTVMKNEVILVNASDGRTEVQVTSGGLLYTCDANGVCKQIVKGSNYLYSDYVFICGDDNKCDGTQEAGYYLTVNSSKAKELYYCPGSEKDCTKLSSLNEGYYPLGPITGTNYKGLIKCESSKCAVDTKAKKGIVLSEEGKEASGYTSLLKKDDEGISKVTVTAGDVFVDPNDTKKVIKCDTSTPKVHCKSEDGTTDEGKAYLDAGSKDGTNGGKTNVIICKSTNSVVKCSSVAVGNAKAAADGVSAQNTAFINAASDSTTSPLITCTSVKCVKAEAGSTAQGHAYLLGTDKKYSKLITCSTTTSCSVISTPNKEDGFAYIDAGSPSGDQAPFTYANIITCPKGACISSVGSKDAGAVYIDAITKSNIINCNEADSKCVSNENDSDEENNKIYICGDQESAKYSKIVVCTNDDGCKVEDGNKTDVPKNYIHGLGPTFLFTCTKNGGCTKGATAATPGFYVDGYTGGIINCVSGDGCSLYDEAIDTDYLTGYISPLTADTQTIIQCTKGDADSVVCEALPALSEEDGNDIYYYINAAKTEEIIKCNYDSGSGSKCASSAGTKLSDSAPSLAYFNKGETIVIQCSDNEDKVCVTVGPTSERPKVNFIEVIGQTEIITCTLSNNKIKCEITDTDNRKPPLYVTDGFAYIDYINEGNIIRCTDEGCISTENDAIAEEDEETPVQNACYLDGYDNTKQTLITCTKTDEGGSCTSEKITTFTETYAFLDGSSIDTGKFTKLLKLNSGNKVIERIEELLLGADGFAYLDGTDKNKKRIITCATGDCKVINNGSMEATEEEEEIIAFYIDGVNAKQIIICTPTTGCKSEVANKNDVDYFPDSQNNNKVIKCIKSGTCAKETLTFTGDEVFFYVDGYKKENVIKCEKDSVCVEEKGNATPGYGYIDSGNATAGNIIVCKENSGCVSIANGSSTGTPPQNTAFIDASKDDSKSIISCSGTTCTPNDLTVDKGIAFLDGTSVNSNGKITNLITCDADNETCEALAASSKKPKTEEGYVYIDGTSDAGSGYTNIIQCTLDKSVISCASETSKTTAEYGYIDATDKRTPITRVITCGASGCESVENEAEEAENDEEGNITTAAVNQFFINGKKDPNIIVCTKEDGCFSIAGSKKLKEKKYYADSKTATNIISCEGPTTEGGTAAACKSTAHADTAGNDVYYIDGYDTKNILICNKDDGCVSSLSLASETQPSHYVDAG
ncbi:hypothetical protein PIROE2DRAFT_1579, partial [Piromyces sp. E2]